MERLSFGHVLLASEMALLLNAAAEARGEPQSADGGEDARPLAVRVREASHVQADNLQLKDLNKIDKTALAFYNKCAERSQKRVARRKERARIRALSYLVVDDFEANAMMDRFEAGQM